MVQEFRVVRCYSCEVFQVNQVGKSNNKWQCKVCNEKQSIKRVYFFGTGKECRLQCQQLNMNRQSENQFECVDNYFEHNVDDGLVEDSTYEAPCENDNIKLSLHKTSKWSSYCDAVPQEQKDHDTSHNNINFQIRDSCKMKRKKLPKIGKSDHKNELHKKIQRNASSKFQKYVFQSKQIDTPSSNSKNTQPKPVLNYDSVFHPGPGKKICSEPIFGLLSKQADETTVCDNSLPNKTNKKCIRTYDKQAKPIEGNRNKKSVSNSKWCQFIDIKNYEESEGETSS